MAPYDISHIFASFVSFLFFKSQLVYRFHWFHLHSSCWHKRRAVGIHRAGGHARCCAATAPLRCGGRAASLVHCFRGVARGRAHNGTHVTRSNRSFGLGFCCVYLDAACWVSCSILKSPRFSLKAISAQDPSQ